jgi:hypothetical protein
MEVFREMFLKHVISLRGELPWPARSPDLCTCDYFLWGYLKAKPYNTRLLTIDGSEASSERAASEVGSVCMQ